MSLVTRGEHGPSPIFLFAPARETPFLTIFPIPAADERRLDETSESCERLRTLLEEVDSNISLVLASTRVRLQNLELQTAIGTLALGAGATIAAFFGA